MSLLDKMEKAMEKKEETVSDDVDDIPPEQNKNRRSYVRRVQSKPTKLVVPYHIKTLFDNLDKSISSVWGVQKSGKVKWDAKYSMWLVFKEYFRELSK